MPLWISLRLESDYGFFAKYIPGLNVVVHDT